MICYNEVGDNLQEKVKKYINWRRAAVTEVSSNTPNIIIGERMAP